MCTTFSSLNFTKDFQVQKATPTSVLLTFEAETRTPVPEGILYKHWVGGIKMANEVDIWKIDDVINSENDITVIEAPWRTKKIISVCITGIRLQTAFTEVGGSGRCRFFIAVWRRNCCWYSNSQPVFMSANASESISSITSDLFIFGCLTALR